MLKKYFLDLAQSNINFVTYVNRELDVVINGSCIVYWGKLKLAYVYVIVDSNGAIYKVLKKGFFLSDLKNEMLEKLKKALESDDLHNPKHRVLYFDSLSSIF